MPNINDFIKDSKPFRKKSYRAWDNFLEDASPNNRSQEILKNNNSSKIKNHNTNEADILHFNGVKNTDSNGVYIPHLNGVDTPLSNRVDAPLSNGIENTNFNGVDVPLLKKKKTNLSEKIDGSFNNFNGVDVPLSNGVDIPLSKSKNVSLSNGVDVPLSNGVDVPLSNGVDISHCFNGVKNKEISLYRKSLSSIDKLNSNNLENSTIRIQKLSGNPLKIILYIFQITEKQNENLTHRLTLSEIAKTLKISRNSARAALRFLLKNSLTKRENFKVGKQGWSQYSVNKTLYKELSILGLKGDINCHKSLMFKKDFKGVYVPLIEKGHNSSSSSNNFYKTTTTRVENKTDNFEHNEAANVVQENNIDIEPLRLAGMTTTRLKQIVNSSNLSTEQIQNSIYAFAFDLKHNDVSKKIKATPINYFMGIVIRGRVYEFPQNYVTPEEDAMRTYLQRLQEVSERKAKLESETREVIRNAWLQGKSENEIQRILDEHTTGDDLIVPERSRKKMVLERYFNEAIWPDKFQEILKSAKS